MIALVLSAAPSDHARTRAGIDLAMTLATFETPFALYFQGPACACLSSEKTGRWARKRLAALPLYGLQTWYADQMMDQPLEGTEVIAPETMQAQLRQCDQVIRL